MKKILLVLSLVLASLGTARLAMPVETIVYNPKPPRVVPPSPSPSPEPVDLVDPAADPGLVTSKPIVVSPAVLVAQTLGAPVVVYPAPDAASKPLATLPAINAPAAGQPQSLLVTDASVPGWLQVMLPLRPNSSRGWITSAGMKVEVVNDYLVVKIREFRLEHYVHAARAEMFRVAVGAPQWPTPTGLFYIWAIQTNPGPPYNPAIFALSAFSDVLTDWPGGGRSALHAWSDPSVVGKPVSHGCVRLRPVDAARLLKEVAPGTPVLILP